MPSVLGASSFSIRKFRSDKIRPLDESSKYDFRCDVCKRNRVFGKNEGAHAKISYQLDGGEKTVQFCSRCADLLIDMFVWGRTPADRMDLWKIRSKLSRFGVLHKDMYCLSCASKTSSHLMIHYDHLSVAGKIGKYGEAPEIVYKRMCARCVVTYIEILLSIKGLYRCKHEYFKASVNGLSNAWHKQIKR